MHQGGCEDNAWRHLGRGTATGDHDRRSRAASWGHRPPGSEKPRASDPGISLITEAPWFTSLNTTQGSDRGQHSSAFIPSSFESSEFGPSAFLFS